MISNSFQLSLNKMNLSNSKNSIFPKKNSILKINPIKEESVQASTEEQSVKSFVFKNKNTTTSFQIDTKDNVSTFISSEKHIRSGSKKDVKDIKILKALTNFSEKNNEGIYFI